MLLKNNSKLGIPVILAPLSGISSLSFRIINRKFGCKFAFLEMVDACSLAHSNKKTLNMMKTYRFDKPLGCQLLGDNMDFLRKSLDNVQAHDFEVIDFNAACPQKKVTSKGQGAALLKDPDKLQRILSMMVKHSNKPVSVKLRLGWDDKVKAKDIALRAEDAGVKLIFLHGRTRAQAYSGIVDYNAIAMVKKALSIPLIASGDILYPQLAKRMFDETGCDGILVARGALGNPWIFKEIEEVLKTGKILKRPSASEIRDTIKRHMELIIKYNGEQSGLIKFRKFFIWYTRGFSGIRPLRAEITRVTKTKDMLKILKKLKASNNKDYEKRYISQKHD